MTRCYIAVGSRVSINERNDIMASTIEASYESPFVEPAAAWRLPDGELPHEETVRVLQTLGGNGVVTNKELLQLGYFLNENHEARHSWPGERLVHLLAEMFDGHTPAKADREEIHAGLEIIEQECAKITAPPAEDEPALPLTALRTEDLVLPKLDLTMAIECPDSWAEFSADLRHQCCDCPTWTHHRGRLKAGDVRRCCVHLVEAYHRVIESGELPGCLPVFQTLMADRAQRGRSLDPSAQWKLVKIRMRPHIVIYSNRMWCYVYAPSGNGHYFRFAYNPGEARWSFGCQPGSANTLALFISEALAGHVT